MATKKLCLKKKFEIFGDSVSENCSQYRNLNLNNTSSCSLITPIQSKIINSFENGRKLFDFSGSKNFQKKHETSVSNNPISRKSHASMILSDVEEEKENGWKRDRNSNFLTKKSSNSSSTLSLHISAYENSIKDDRIDLEEVSIKKKNSFGKTWNHAVLFKDSFEIPRQPENKLNDPEVMQFKASQKLFDPNTSNAKSHKMITQEYADESMKVLEKTGIACDRLRMELKRCIKESECVQVDRRPAAECIQAPNGHVPDRCFVLLTSLSDCKRSMIDMRSRFRGRKGDL